MDAQIDPHALARAAVTRPAGVLPSPHSGDPPSVLKDLTAFGHRARVELIEYGGRWAVRKLFRPGAERFAEREATILGRYGGRHPAIAKLLESGPLHVIYEYAENELHLYRLPHGRFWPRPLLPLTVAWQAFEALRFFHNEGYALLDFHPGNLLFSRRTGLRVIDFEFVHRYGGPVPPFEQSYSLVGVPAGFTGDLPESWEWDRTPYEAKWWGYIGLPLESFLQEAPPIQRFRRALYQARMTTRRPGWKRKTKPPTSVP